MLVFASTRAADRSQARFQDPFNLDSQLSEDEIAIRCVCARYFMMQPLNI
jgi:hypothetical protein